MTRPDIAAAGVKAVCHALCQSCRFETGEGTCAAICLSMLGSARGGPHGCDYAERVHGELAQSVADALLLARKEDGNG